MTKYKTTTSQTEALISVIVPVYNVESYLERCINSILNQTYKFFELILVDDGSPDNCPQICDDFAKKDGRIKVIHKQNGGLSDARNAALDIATGRYIMFVDSDDAIAPNCLQLLFDSAYKNDSDIVISTYFKIFDKNIALENAEIKNSVTVDSAKALEMVFCDNTRWEAWGSLFKRNIFKSQRFPNGKLYEDLALIPKIIINAKKVCFIDTAVYYYFKRVGSIMDYSKTTVKIDLLEICSDLLSLTTKKIFDKVSLNNINSGILMELCSRVDLAEKNYQKNREFILKSRKYLRKNIKFVLLANRYSIKKKIYYFIISFCLGKLLKLFY